MTPIYVARLPLMKDTIHWFMPLLSGNVMNEFSLSLFIRIDLNILIRCDVYIRFGSCQSETAAPTKNPTIEPTNEPTLNPTREPTTEPTLEPSAEPTAEPSVYPTMEPTTTVPTDDPTEAPTEDPTDAPTEDPTLDPTEAPTSASPTTDPTSEPTHHLEVPQVNNCTVWIRKNGTNRYAFFQWDKVARSGETKYRITYYASSKNGDTVDATVYDQFYSTSGMWSPSCFVFDLCHPEKSCAPSS